MESEFLSYAELAVLEKKEREELEMTKKALAETREILSEMEKWWKDSSQANFVLASRLKSSEEKLTEMLKEERRQKEVWKEAYESVTGSRTWTMMGKVKKVFGKK